MRTWSKRRPSNWFDEALPKIGLSVLFLIVAVTGNYSRWKSTQEGREWRECVGNLEQMLAAVQHWAVEHQRAAGDTIVPAEVLPYFKGSRLPTCPGDGSYQLPGTVGELPTCSIPGHRVHK